MVNALNESQVNTARPRERISRHVHVFPRYGGDRLYKSSPLPGWASFDERQVYAKRLRAYFGS
jgi:hypothetical protein